MHPPNSERMNQQEKKRWAWKKRTRNPNPSSRRGNGVPAARTTVAYVFKVLVSLLPVLVHPLRKLPVIPATILLQSVLRPSVDGDHLPAKGKLLLALFA